jgi:hypothetical protein
LAYPVTFVGWGLSRSWSTGVAKALTSAVSRRASNWENAEINNACDDCMHNKTLN